MSRPLKPGKTKIDLPAGAQRPSRIRREPPPQPGRSLKQTVLPSDPESEAWTVLIGVLLFGIAITIIIFAVSEYTSG